MNWINANFKYLNEINLQIFGDSNLLIKDLKGEITIKKHFLRTVMDNTVFILEKCTKWSAQHTLRKGNKLADYLANAGMDDKQEPKVQEGTLLALLRNDHPPASQIFNRAFTLTRSGTKVVYNSMLVYETQWRSNWEDNEINISPTPKTGIG